MTRIGVSPMSDSLATTQHVGASTIDRVLAAVGAILDTGGEGSLRLAEVSRRSGVSVGSLYHHFGSREGVIDAARERQLFESLSDDTFEEAKLRNCTSTAEFVEKVGSWIRETPARAQSRQRRLETIATAARRPGHFPGVMALESAHLDVGEQIAQGLLARGLLRDGVDARAMALLLDVMAMSGSLRDVDVHPVATDAWEKLLQLCLEGLLASSETTCCPV